MNTVDIILGIFLLLGLVRGWILGFTHQLFSIAGLVIAFLGTPLLAPSFERFLMRYAEATQSLAKPLSFLIVFLLIMIIASILGRIFRHMIRWAKLGILDTLGGILFYEIKVILLCSISLHLMALIDPHNSWITPKTTENSYLYKPILSAVPTAMGWVADEMDFPELKRLAPKNK